MNCTSQTKKMINEVYLNTIAKRISDFNDNQKLIINSIANQCAISGGRAVYLARLMKEYYSPNVDYTDIDESCDSEFEGKVVVENNEAGFVEYIYPNPAQDELNIILKESLTNGRISIVDLLGRELMSLEIPTDLQKVSLNTKALYNGVYFVVIFDNNEIVYSDKISIQK